MTNYLDLSLNEIHELLKSHKIKPIDLVLESFRRIEENNLNDFITLNKEEAIKEAKALENLEIDNILFGMPIAIKDTIVLPLPTSPIIILFILLFDLKSFSLGHIQLKPSAL